MESAKQLIDIYDDDYVPSKKDFVEDYLDTDFLQNNIILCGQSWSGKTTLLQNVLIKNLIHWVPHKNIYIFSATCSFDLCYRPLFQYLARKLNDDQKKEEKKLGCATEVTKTQKINIYEDVDMDLIEKITRKQKNLQKKNMMLDKKDRIKIEPILFIYDDMLGSSQLKSWNSKLATFSTLSRHNLITNIYLTQNHTSIPSTIRRQTPIIVLLTCDNYSDVMIEEQALKGQKKQLAQWY